MQPRSLTERERAVLDALLSVDFDGVAELREQAAKAVVVDVCSCGCPSINFQQPTPLGMTQRVNAAVRESFDGLFLYTFEDPERGEVLGGIEWSGVTDPSPNELPEPRTLDIKTY